MKTSIQQEKLLPAILTSKSQFRPKVNPPEFTGTINVNPLAQQQRSPLDLRLQDFEEPKTDKNRRNFSNAKEERFYRLNRDSKLRINEEISNYLKTQQRSVKKIHIRNELEQIKDAAKQLNEINFILDHNKKNPAGKNDQKKSSVDGLSFLDTKPSKSKLPSQSNLKHLCTKGLRNKMTRYNVTNSVKRYSNDPDMDDKEYFSTPDVLNATDLLKKIANQRNKKVIRTAIESLNNRLQSSKEKILQDYEDSKKQTKKISNTDYLRRGPRYRSIRDVKIDQVKVEEFENEVKRKSKLVEDPKEMKIIFKNNVFHSQESEVHIDKTISSEKSKKYQRYSAELNDLKIKPNYEDVKIKQEAASNKPEKPEIPTLMSPKLLKEFDEMDFEKIKKLEKIRHKAEMLNKLIDMSPRMPKTPRLSRKSPINSPKSPIETAGTNSIAVGNEENHTGNDLEKSILNSSYLSKEFHLNDRFEPKEEDNIVNWADKFKISTTNKKWSKDVEYFLT